MECDCPPYRACQRKFTTNIVLLKRERVPVRYTVPWGTTVRNRTNVRTPSDITSVFCSELWLLPEAQGFGTTFVRTQYGVDCVVSGTYYVLPVYSTGSAISAISQILSATLYGSK